MGKLFLVFGLLVSLMFSYATYAGYSVWDSMTTGHWGPDGKQQHGAIYHK